MELPNSIGELFSHIEKQTNPPVFRHRMQFHTRKFTLSDLSDLALRFTNFLAAKNIKKGDRIIICAPNSPEWVVSMMTCAISGVILVPLDYNSHEDFIVKIAKEVDAKLVVTSLYKNQISTVFKNIIFVEQLFEQLANEQRVSPATLPEIIAEDIFEIIYTSGTTSDPKGVVLTHKNIISNLHAVLSVVDHSEKYKVLSIIPLSHILEQTVGFFAFAKLGATIVYISTLRPSVLMSTMRNEKINAMVTVPAFLELFKNRIEQALFQKGIFSFTKMLMEIFHIYPFKIKRVLFKPILRQFGNLKLFIVGGARLSADVEKYWRDFGVLILQGYGLTETTALVTCNSFKEQRIGTVGKAAYGQQIKIADDYEILISGDNVTQGYYKKPRESKILLEGGWLHSGDLGEIDSEGYLTIKGRKKNMLVGSAGLKIYPEDIEAELNKTNGIKD